VLKTPVLSLLDEEYVALMSGAKVTAVSTPGRMLLAELPLMKSP